MTTALDRIRAAGASVWIAGPDRIGYCIPRGRRDLLDYIREHKSALIAHLRSEALRRGEYDLPPAEPDPADVLRAWLEAGALADLPSLAIAPGVRITDPVRAARSVLLGMATGGRVAEADRRRAERFIAAVRPLIDGGRP